MGAMRVEGHSELLRTILKVNRERELPSGYKVNEAKVMETIIPD